MKISKFFWGGGIAPSPDPSPGGEGDTPSPHPTPSAPAAPRFSRLRRSAFPHFFFFFLQINHWLIPIADERLGASKTVKSLENKYLSASAAVIHYEEALYQVYAPLPLS